MAKYSVTQSAVTQLLADVKSDRIAIPGLQRPFVWDSVKVRDLDGYIVVVSEWIEAASDIPDALVMPDA